MKEKTKNIEKRTIMCLTQNTLNVVTDKKKNKFPYTNLKINVIKFCGDLIIRRVWCLHSYGSVILLLQKISQSYAL